MRASEANSEGGQCFRNALFDFTCPHLIDYISNSLTIRKAALKKKTVKDPHRPGAEAIHFATGKHGWLCLMIFVGHSVIFIVAGRTQFSPA